MNYLDEVLQRAIVVLDGDIQLLKNKLADAPPGELRSYKNTRRGKEKYVRYFYNSNGRKYLKNDDLFKSVQYAQNTFLKCKLVDLESKRNRLKEFIDKEQKYAESAEKYANSNDDIKSLLNGCQLLWDDEIAAWANEPYEKADFFPEHLQYETDKGDMVRSRAEMTIANFLYEAKIPYRYEPKIVIGGEVEYPDFLILDPITKELFILEYLGLLKIDAYDVKNRNKLIRYIKNGYIPSLNLILISESENIPFDASYVRDILRHYFGTFL